MQRPQASDETDARPTFTARLARPAVLSSVLPSVLPPVLPSGLPSPAEAVLVDGTVVRAARGGSTVEICRADGTRLFRYDAETGRGRITLENESLELASAGDLRLRAAGEVRIEGQSVRACARQPGAEATLRLDPRQATIAAATVKLDGQELAVTATRAALHSEDFTGVIGRAVIEARRLETTADVVVQTARNLYQQVHELAQQHAGSLRTIVEGTVHLKAKQVFQRAIEAYKIRAEKINLG